MLLQESNLLFKNKIKSQYAQAKENYLKWKLSWEFLRNTSVTVNQRPEIRSVVGV